MKKRFKHTLLPGPLRPGPDQRGVRRADVPEDAWYASAAICCRDNGGALALLR